MLGALVAGTVDPVVVADLARGRLRKKIPLSLSRDRPTHVAQTYSGVPETQLVHVPSCTTVVLPMPGHSTEDVVAPGGHVTAGTVQLALTALKPSVGLYAMYPDWKGLDMTGVTTVSVAALVVAEPAAFVNTA
jgi:hypothetical protein